MFVGQKSNNQINMKGNEQGFQKFSMLSLKNEIIYLQEDDIVINILYHFEHCTTIVFNFAAQYKI